MSAVAGIDLEVNEGEWIAIMGPSGSGKSTLLNLIAGLDTPDEGSIMVGGEEMSGASLTKRALFRRNKVGIVLQSLNLLADLTALQNVELPLRIAGAKRRSSSVEAMGLLMSLGIGELAHRRPDELSGGQQQRVAIARALANRPAVVLADEPTGALDRASATGVLDVLRAANLAGQTLVVVTHDHRVASHADRIVTLEDGCLI